VSDARYSLIVDDQEFRDFVDRTIGLDCYAIDTEFHRERSYFPRVALIQINNGSEVVLIDPLAVDPEPMRNLLESDSIAVLHAASQDLEVFQHWAGALPGRIFDTQLAAGFGSPSRSYFRYTTCRRIHRTLDSIPGSPARQGPSHLTSEDVSVDGLAGTATHRRSA